MAIQIKDKILFNNSNEIKGSVEILKGSDDLLKLENYNDCYEGNVITSCYRGYLAQYSFIDNKLTLEQLQINSEYDISIISNNAIRVTQNTLNNYTFKQSNLPMTYDKNILFDEKYTNINLPINYNGKLLVGYKKNHSSILTSNDNMNYWSNKYKQLIEIKLSKGVFLSSRVLDEEEINKTIKDEKNNISKIFYNLKQKKIKNIKYFKRNPKRKLYKAK